MTKELDQQIQEEIDRIKREVIEVNSTNEKFSVRWIPRFEEAAFEERTDGRSLAPKDQQIYEDLQLSRGASRPINQNFEWEFDDPAQGIGVFAKRNKERLKHFLYHAPISKTSHILDIGARTGQLLYYLREQGYHSIAGIDVVKLNVLWCQKNGFDVQMADAHKLSTAVGTAKFDAIFAYHVLEHCYDPPKVLQEFHKVLRDDGVVHIEIPLGDVDLSKAHVYGYKKGELASLLENAGFYIFDVSQGANERIVAGKQPPKPISLWNRIRNMLW